MSDIEIKNMIDRAFSAIKTLEQVGYTYHAGEYWKPPIGNISLNDAAPAMYKLLSRLWELNCPQEYCTEDEYSALTEIEDLLSKARGA